MPSSAIGSVLESMPGSVLENVLGYLGEYSECTWESLESLLGSISQAGWECAIESNWERIVKQAGSVQSSAIRSVLQSVDGSVQ